MARALWIESTMVAVGLRAAKLKYVGSEIRRDLIGFWLIGPK